MCMLSVVYSWIIWYFVFGINCIYVSHAELEYSSSVDVRAMINKIAYMKRQAIEEAIEADIQVPVDDLDNLSNIHVALKLRKSLRNVKTGLNMNPCINSEDISEKKIEEPIYSFLWLMVPGKSVDDVNTCI